MVALGEPLTITRSFRHDDEDGSDYADRVEATEGFRVIWTWGLDGWDVGELPYWQFFHNHDYTAIREYCEGDITTWEFATRQDGIAFMDAIAERLWRQKGHIIDELVQYPEGELPERYRGPFSWERLKNEKEGWLA
jgi:hypothetical protein